MMRKSPIRSVSIVTGMWSNRAIAEWATHRTGASTSLSTTWAALKADLGRHLLIAIAIVIVALAGSSLFASFSFPAVFGQAMNHGAVFNLFSVPLRLAGSFLNIILSATITGWALGVVFGAGGGTALKEGGRSRPLLQR